MKREYKEKLIQSIKLHWKGIKEDRKCDLYIYFYLHGLALLKPGGTFCFITSNSWLDVGYGRVLQQLLLEEIEIKAIFDNQAKRSFSSADVNTVISLFKRPSVGVQNFEPLHPSPKREDNLARFVLFKKPFDACLTADNLIAIFKEDKVATRDDYRLYPISQGDLFQEGVEKTDQQSLPEGKMSGKYTGGKWGGKYLRAPDIFFTILEKGKGKLVRLGDIAEVRRGFTTGANEFFYLDKERIDEWGIEEEFLRPVIFSLKEIHFIEDDLKGLQYKAFMCHIPKSALYGMRALKYIEWGETQGFNERPTCLSRKSWYYIGEGWKPAPLIFPAKVGERMLVLNNKKSVLEDKKLYGIMPRRGSKLYWASILNSTLTRFFMDLACRQLTGAQAIADIDVRVVEDIEILTPEFFDEHDLEPVYNNLAKRPIFSHVTDEYSQLDRRALDNIIFDILGLTQGERDAVYEAVVELVKNRLEKARSV